MQKERILQILFEQGFSYLLLSNGYINIKPSFFFKFSASLSSRSSENVKIVSATSLERRGNSNKGFY